MAAYPWVTHHGYRYRYTLGPKMATRYSYPYPHHGYGLLTGTGPGTAKNTWELPMQITSRVVLIAILMVCLVQLAPQLVFSSSLLLRCTCTSLLSSNGPVFTHISEIPVWCCHILFMNTLQSITYARAGCANTSYIMHM